MNSLPLRAATGYGVLLASEEHFHSKLVIQNHRRKWHIVTILFWTFVALLSLWGTLNLFSTMLNYVFPPKEVNCNCGSSIAEAILKGCKYDAMATSWLPPACRDDELSTEFDSAGPGGRWDYYADRDGNRSYTLEEVALLAEKKGPEAEFWTTHEWHINHCLFYWRKESRARVSGKVVIEKSFEGDYHVHHCSTTLTACRPLDEINTKSVAWLNSDL